MTASPEIASVLFTDIVSYSLLPMDRQSEMLTALQGVVKASSEFQQAKARDTVISLPTGDGMALVFFGDPLAAVRCAVELAKGLQALPDLKLRIGINSGPVFRHADIKDQLNVVGGGINLCQRVMDCGNAGHILLSENVASTLLQLSAWRDWVHDLGIFQVKHGVEVHVYNFYKDGVGRVDPPPKKKTTSSKRRSKAPLLAAVAAIAAAGVYYFATPNTRTLSYYVTVQKYRGGKPYEEPFRLSGPRIFEAGYGIHLVFTSPTGGYLYILNEAPQSTSQRPVFNVLAASHLDPGSELQIPNGGPIVFDNERGVEKLWLVFSKKSLPDFEALRRWLNPQDKGAIGDTAQLNGIQRFLESQAQAESVEEKDHTTIRGRRDILVSLLKLQHD